jgi:hypothetical protein
MVDYFFHSKNSTILHRQGLMYAIINTEAVIEKGIYSGVFPGKIISGH